MFRVLLGLAISLSCGTVMAAPVLNSAILPNSRVVPLNDDATFFMTTLNTGDVDATNCQVRPSTAIGGTDLSTIDVKWTLVGPPGNLIGNQNDPFTIPASSNARVVLGVNRNATATAANVFFYPRFHVECDGGFASAAWPAVNGAQIQFSDTTPDIIPIIQTFSADGITNFDDTNRLAVVSVAAINNTAITNSTGEVPIGIGGQFLGFNSAGQFDFYACESDTTGACINPMQTCSPSRWEPCFTSMIGATAKTFSFFLILPPEQGAPFLPQAYRFATSFHNAIGSVISTTSVALDSSAPVHAGTRPLGPYEFIARNSDDYSGRTLRGGKIIVGEDEVGGILYRSIDRGAFIQIVEQYFFASGDFTEVGGGNSCSEATPCQTEMLADLTCDFFDTGLGATSDAATNSCDAIIQPEEGGVFTLPEVTGQEQISGEPDIFDALNSAEFIAGSDFASRISFADYRKKTWLEASTDGFNFTEEVFETTNGIPLFSLEGCDFEVIALGGPAEMVIGATFQITDCDPASRIASLQGTAATSQMYVEKQSDGSCIYQFVLSLDKTDPDAGTFTFFIQTSTPDFIVNDTPQISKLTENTINKRAANIAGQHNKPVYWFINGKNVLAAKPKP